MFATEGCTYRDLNGSVQLDRLRAFVNGHLSTENGSISGSQSVSVSGRSRLRIAAFRKATIE